MKHSRTATVGCLAAVLALSACGGSSSGGNSPAPTGGSPSTSGGSSGTSDVVAQATAALKPYYDVRTWPTPTTGPAATAGKSVWWISCGLASPACALDATEAQTAGKKMGWNVRVFDGNFGLDDAYSKGVRQAVAARADGIILHDIECGTVKQALVEAKAAKIPVLAVQGPDCPGASDLQVDYKYTDDYPGPSEFSFLSGQVMGWKVIEATGGKAHLLYYHILGNEGSERVAAGIKDSFSKCSDCSFKEEDVPLAQLSPALGQRVQSDFLGNADANAVAVPFASVYDVGLGAGIARVNRPVFVMSSSSSISYYNSMRKAKNGVVLGTLSISALQQAWGALDDMNRLLNNQGVVSQGGFMAVTDLDHNLPPAGEDFDGPSNASFFDSKLPYKADYEKIWKG